MNAISADALEDALMRWVTEGRNLNLQLDEQSGVIIDGKVLRGTRSDHRRIQQILAAIDQHTGCVLSETHIDEDTNEAKTTLRFLKRLVLQGKVVVGDADYCQRDVCETVLSEHSDYLALIKDNQPTLHNEAIQAFVIPEGFFPPAPNAKHLKLEAARRLWERVVVALNVVVSRQQPSASIRATGPQ